MTADDEFFSTPEMLWTPALVKMPEADLVSPNLRGSGISVGACYVPGCGPGIFFGIHDPGGQVRIAILDVDRYRDFGDTVNVVIARVIAGDYDRGPTAN